MDAWDKKSYLLGLQTLYGLLKNDGDCMTNPASNMLDKHARLLLKYFLDSATQRSLKVYSEMFAGQVEVLQTPCASHLQQKDNTIEEQSSRLQMTREVDHNYRNDPGSEKERKVDGLDFKLRNDQRFIRQRSQVDSLEQSTPSADATGAEFRKKRCRVCQRSTIKQIVTNDDTAKHSDRLTYPKHEENNDFEATYKGEEADYISKEASKAIELLESCIAGLNLLEEFSGQHEIMDSKVESGNWRTTHNDIGPNQIQHAWNASVAADHKTSPRPSTFSSAPKMANPHQNHLAMKNERYRYGVFRPSKPANTFGQPNYSEELQSIDSSRNITSKLRTRCKKYHPLNTTATLQERPHQSDLLNKNGVTTRRNSMTASRMSLNQQEIEDPASSLYSSNMRRSQQASSYGSVGEDYSLSDQSGSHYITSTSSESRASPQSHGTMRDYDSYTSKSEDDQYSSPSGNGATEVASTSSGKSDRYSSYDQPMNRHAGSSYSSMTSTPRKKIPVRIRKSVGGINHKKQSKTWKRMKDRLAIIFNHHHHHHHHHHHDDHRGSHWKRMNVSTLFKNRERKIIHSKQGDEAYGERAVENMRKSLIHDKYQKGHLHDGLAKAFLRHIWHSKKSKVAKETSCKLSKNQVGRKKASKKSKSRWLKMLQHQRRGNFPKKAHVRLGLGKKKIHLKALRN